MELYIHSLIRSRNVLFNNIIFVQRKCAFFAKAPDNSICTSQWNSYLLLQPSIISNGVNQLYTVYFTAPDNCCGMKLAMDTYRCKYKASLCNIVDFLIKIDQLDVTCFIISLFTAQHVSNVSKSIFRSLRLTVDLFHVLYCSGSMCVGVTVWFGWGGVVSLCWLRH